MQYLRDKRLIVVTSLLVIMFLIMPYDGIILNHIRQLKVETGIVNSIFAALMPIAKFMGDGAFIAIVAIFLWIAGIFIKKEFMKQTGKVMFIAYIISGITVQALKHLLGRARPRLTDDIVFIGPSFVSGFDSFPSGHTAVVFCLAYIFSIQYRRFSLIFFLLAIVTAIERVYNLSHFPSDVIAGIITGIVTAIVISHRLIEKRSN